MATLHKYSILVVDDDEGIREVLENVLTGEGYVAHCADNGLSALQLLNTRLSDLIISDLHMPVMSGFEFLSVVRRRFPQISVIANSGAYAGNSVPEGVIADAFHAKGGTLKSLLAKIAELLITADSRAHIHAGQSSPVWIPRNGKDSFGIPYIVLTCDDCLRSFPISVRKEPTAEVLNTPCVYCGKLAVYIIDFSLSVFSPPSAKNVASISRSYGIAQ
jgi:CheY-like chemotaxis protein